MYFYLTNTFCFWHVCVWHVCVWHVCVWQNIDPYNLHGMRNDYRKGRLFLEVSPPDWTGSATAKDRIGASVVIFDPKDVMKQLRLSQRRFEVRDITPFTNVAERNNTINGHDGWTPWAQVESGNFF